MSHKRITILRRFSYVFVCVCVIVFAVVVFVIIIMNSELGLLKIGFV